MKTLHLIAKLFILIVGLMIVMLSLDVFEMEGSIWELLGGFFIHALPAIIILLILGLFWWKERLLGLLTLLAASFLFVFFELYQNIEDSWITLLIMIVPLVVSGIILTIKKNK